MPGAAATQFVMPVANIPLPTYLYVENALLLHANQNYILIQKGGDQISKKIQIAM